MASVSSIRNLGPASDQSFARAGITSAEQLRSLGAHEAYRLLLKSGAKSHFIGFYALVMGLQGRPWNDCHGDEKQRLRAEFDAIKRACSKPAQSELEQFLQDMGLAKPD